MDSNNLECLLSNYKGDNISAHFMTAFGREVYSLFKNLAYTDDPILLFVKKLKKLLTHYFHMISA